jgi:hypothetical protein
MRYSRGDVVRFKVGSNEIHEGKVQIIEKSREEDILYINSFSGWAYKISEKSVVSRINGY